MVFISAAGEAVGFALWQPLVRSVVLRHGGEEIAVELRVASDDRCEIAVPGATVLAERQGGRWRFDGVPGATVHREAAQVTVFDAYGMSFDIVDPLARAAGAGAGAALIEAPMPGLVRQVLAVPGQAVAAGDTLAVLEAMKMEHALLASRDGTVAEVLVAEGAQVEAGAALIRLEDEDEDAA